MVVSIANSEGCAKCFCPYLGTALKLWLHAAVIVTQSYYNLQVLELFKAADKYDVPGLVKECVQIFKKITHAADVAPLLQVS